MPSRIVPSVLALVSVLPLGCDDGVVGPPPPVHPPPSFYHAPPDPVGLISYWKFNDADGTTAADAVGTHHGTLVNGPEWTAGQVGGALRFDGLDDYVDAGLGGADLGGLVTFTLEAWVKWEGEDRFQPYSILAKPAGGGALGYEFGYGFALTTRWSPTPGYVQLFAWSNEDGWWPWERSATAIPRDMWAHVAVTCEYLGYQSRVFSMYINGVAVPFGARDLGLTMLAEPRVYIGAGFTHGLFSGSTNFKGVIDELAIHGSVLPPGELRRHYENGLRGLGYENVLHVAIDIKPGSDPNSIKLGSKGTIPVAILSTADFDAPAEVDRASLTFGRTGDEASLSFCGTTPKDVNADGKLDLVCHFTTSLTGFQSGDTEGILKGETVGGTPIEGRDAVRVVS